MIEGVLEVSELDAGGVMLPRSQIEFIDIGVEPLVATLRGVRHASDASLRDVGDNARWFAAERYSWSAAARTMREAYAWLVHGGPGGAPPSCIRLDRTREP
jgi:hypothetical protein